MDSWERFNETSLSDKQDFYSNLNMEYITDVDHRHAKKVFNEVAANNLSNKNVGDYHVFENFRNMCIKVSEL